MDEYYFFFLLLPVHCGTILQVVYWEDRLGTKRLRVHFVCANYEHAGHTARRAWTGRLAQQMRVYVQLDLYKLIQREYNAIHNTRRAGDDRQQSARRRHRPTCSCSEHGTACATTPWSPRAVPTTWDDRASRWWTRRVVGGRRLSSPAVPADGRDSRQPMRVPRASASVCLRHARDRHERQEREKG